VAREAWMEVERAVGLDWLLVRTFWSLYVVGGVMWEEDERMRGWNGWDGWKRGMISMNYENSREIETFDSSYEF
jgi:hypothetical protein